MMVFTSNETSKIDQTHLSQTVVSEIVGRLINRAVKGGDLHDSESNCLSETC